MNAAVAARAKRDAVAPRMLATLFPRSNVVNVHVSPAGAARGAAPHPVAQQHGSSDHGRKTSADRHRSPLVLQIADLTRARERCRGRRVELHRATSCFELSAFAALAGVED